MLVYKILALPIEAVWSLQADTALKPPSCPKGSHSPPWAAGRLQPQAHKGCCTKLMGAGSSAPQQGGTVC